MKSIVIKENKDFRRMYYRAKSKVSPILVTYVMKNHCGFTRYGITAGKKIGHAVQRNRAKRIIRVAFAELESKLCGNFDIIFVARTKTTTIKMQQLLREMEKQLKELNAIK